MFHRKQEVKIMLVQLVASLIILPCITNCLIITSVIAGDKKFKTISFDSKFIKPLMFESELPTTEFRRHRTVRPPKFDIDVNIPIKLPVEDEYAYEKPEYRKPVVSDFAIETGEIVDNDKKYYPKNGYKKANYYRPRVITNKIKFKESLDHAASNGDPRKVAGVPAANPLALPATAQQRAIDPIKRSANDAVPNQQEQVTLNQPQYNTMNQENMISSQDSDNDDNIRRRNSYQTNNYPRQQDYQQPPEFVPGGFVNLQLSGPTGGPKMTYEDFDREKWAQQLSQALGAMPVPHLNYHQLQNFYGGLGTFTNGLSEKYYYEGPLEKIKKLLLAFKG